MQTFFPVNQQEVTVKGLEPDIQKLIAKHKAEVKKLKSTHQVRSPRDQRMCRYHVTCWFDCLLLIPSGYQMLAVFAS